MAIRKPFCLTGPPCASPSNSSAQTTPFNYRGHFSISSASREAVLPPPTYRPSLLDGKASCRARFCPSNVAIISILLLPWPVTYTKGTAASRRLARDYRPHVTAFERPVAACRFIRSLTSDTRSLLSEVLAPATDVTFIRVYAKICAEDSLSPASAA